MRSAVGISGLQAGEDVKLLTCLGALDQARKENQRLLEMAANLADGDLSNPVCVGLLRAKDNLQAAYGNVIREIERRARDAGDVL